ncbi:arginine:ornithine antiporter/lysine permease [Weissella uvarum]|uniref:amino acid permease n=1 Tax=Weissella uvarum TaxID=1479233 RepID=UPI00196080B5|nr:amino acid permease [Weissella uvarum]MBM7618056.1 arginine:ornithine antiporter/lysine permease [Weissella uvarum]MCM0595087.1 amino acid permease [Weissella uvarum]
MDQDQNKGGAKKLGLIALISGVVTSCLGSGIFNVSSTLAQGSTVGVSIVAWIFVMVGIGALSWVFTSLSKAKPELTGVTDYAYAGAGKLAAASSGIAYFVSGFCGNLAFLLMLTQAFSIFSKYVPFLATFEKGNSPATLIFVSLFSWFLTWAVIKFGAEKVSSFNTIVTFFKVSALFVFVIFGVIFFRSGIFTAHFWKAVADNAGQLTYGKMTFGNFVKQFGTGLFSMIFLFVGIESASMLGDRAAKKSDIGKATMIGTIVLFFLYFVISLLPFGMLSQQELATISQPGLVYVTENTVGPIGSAFMSVALIITLVGALLSWFLLPVEPLERLADQGIFPKWMGKTNAVGSPVGSLVFTQILLQILILTLIFTDSAYEFALSLCTVTIVISYFFVGTYQMQLGLRQHQVKTWLPGLIVVAFEIIAVAVSGLQYLALSSLVLVLGFGFYIYTVGSKRIKTTEWVIMGVITLIAIGTVIALATGYITI